MTAMNFVLLCLPNSLQSNVLSLVEVSEFVYLYCVSEFFIMYALSSHRYELYQFSVLYTVMLLLKIL